MGLLREWNGLGAIADVDLESFLARGDRQALVAELADHVEGLLQRLLERQPQRVRRDRALDLGADVCRRLEEAVSRDQPVERLVRALEVVVRQVVHEPLLRVDGVSEDRAAEKLVPQRLPEAFDLAQRLRMLRPTADVVNSHPPESLFEFGLAPPHRVLPAVVGQYFGRLPIRRDAVLESLHHQRRLLVMRERVPDDEAAVVVHEHAHVQPLRAPQPEREDIRLPQLVRCRPLEPPRPVLPRRCRCRRLDQTFLVQDLPDLLLGYADRLEPREHVTNPPGAPGFVCALERHHLVLDDRIRSSLRPRLAALGRQRFGAALPERRRPFLHRGRRDPERARHLVHRRALHPLLDHQQLVLGRDLATPSSLSLRVRHPVSSSADSCQRFGEEGAR